MTFLVRFFIVLLLMLASLFNLVENAEALRHVRVGYFALSGYQEIDEEGNYRGYGYDFLERLRFYNDWEYEFLYYDKGFSYAFQALQEGKIDIMTSVVKTPERAELYAFSDKPVGTSRTILTCKNDNMDFESGEYDTYNGARIGIIKGHSRAVSLQDFARENHFYYTPVYYDTTEELENALQSGQVDMLVSNNLRAVKNERILDIFDPKSFYLITRKADVELMNEANYAISMLYTDSPVWGVDTWKKYYTKAPDSELHLTNKEKEYLASLADSGKKIKVLFVPDQLPHSYYDKNKRTMNGSLVNYFQKLAEKVGLKYEVVIAKDIEEFLYIFKNGKIDVVVGLPTDYSMAERMNYVITDPIIEVSLAMLMPNDVEKVEKLAINEYSSSNYIWGGELSRYGSEIIKFTNNIACIEAVNKGVCDAFIIDIYGAQIAKSRDLTDKLVIRPLSENVNACIGVHGDIDRRLVNVLNKGIVTMGKNGAETMITQQMMELSKDKSIRIMIRENPEMSVLIGCMAVIMIALSIFFSLRHRHMILIQKKNEELEESYQQQHALNEELQAIYEQQQAQNEELQAMNINLEDSQKKVMEASKAKTTFLFNMSHDIRTPMNAIIGFTLLLEKHMEEREKAVDYIKKIQGSSNFLLSLINNVLDLARIESGKATIDETVVDLEEFGNTIYAVFAEQMKTKGIDFQCELNTIHKKGFCDELKLKQIFLNILSNAMKYTPSGGSVIFKVKEIPCDMPGYCTFVSTVQDTGIGMSEEYLSHIYDDFSRERTSTECKVVGTGLGMPIVKKLVDLMGGTIEVESRLGEGTLFTITLNHRYTDGDYESETMEIDETQVSMLAGKRLLIAEDNDFNAEIAEEILEEYGFITERAVDGVECVHMLEVAEHGYYDAILMDVQMPNMDGYRATRVIREMKDKEKANTIIIAMTANAFEEDKENAFKAGMNDHIAKPIDIGILLSTLLKYL